MELRADHNDKRWKNAFFSVLAILFLLLTVGGSLFLLRGRETAPAATAPEEENVSVEKHENIVSLPGYEFLSLKANTAQQEIELANPPENTCYIRISLILSDGETLWVSDLIEPGKKSGALCLSRPLAPGTYAETLLHYDCFRMDESLTPLNGAEMKLTLRVK